MKLVFHKVDTLPRLSWCAKIRRGDDTIEVLHGPWVEVADKVFTEGAWSGNFSVGDFESSMFMGTGGKVVNDAFLIACPSHTLDRINLLKEKDAILVSNSLPFLLAQAKDNVDSRYLLYDSILASIKDGLKKYVRLVPTRSGKHIQLYYHCNLFISSDLQVIEQAKKPVREFINFTDYKSFLEEQVLAIHANATDAKRKIKYRPITTISSGYDSPAASVLARIVGCDEALTIRNARGTDDTDSGAQIAAILGMKITVFDRLDYIRQTDFPEAENSGGPNEFISLADSLKGRLVFTGFHGDKIWDRDCQMVSPYIVRGDSSGSSLTELRLRVGFVHLPVPFLGCTSHSSIHKISISKEMEPWRLMSNYDRPIARRLVEQAGISRDMFGIKKKAAGVVVTEEGIEPTMSKKSFADFKRFCEENWDLPMAVKSRFFRLVKYLVRKNAWFSRKVTRVLRKKMGIRIKFPMLIPRSIRAMTYGYIGKESLLFHWGVNKIIPRYKMDSNSKNIQKSDFSSQP